MLKCIESRVWGINLNYKYLLRIKDIAVRLGLKGIASFKDDGSAKIIAEGEERNLLFFVNELKHSHFFEDFSMVWREPENKFTDFSVC